MAAKQFQSKAPTEKVVLSFDFSAALAALSSITLSSIYAYSVSVLVGTDANPSAILNGLPSIDASGKKVLVPVMDGLDKVDYLVTIVAQTSDPLTRLTLAGALPVRAI